MRAMGAGFSIGALLIVRAALSAYPIDPDAPHMPGVVVFQVVPELKPDLPPEGSARFGVEDIDRIAELYGVNRFEPAFPNCLPPVTGGVDLSLIFRMSYSGDAEVAEVCGRLAMIPGVEYAEPWYLNFTFFEPNDPRRGNQYGLRLCHAYEAFDISRGDPEVVVGIIDSGIDQDHEDLVGNRWVNPGEDLNGDGTISNNERNGRDDDNNGFVDDFYGWDFLGRDNNPDDAYGHGTHVAGIASAVTNNGVGVASVAFSCSLMGVRVGNDTIYYGYDGINYAVRNGVKVINVSWGRSGGPSATEENVVNYAYQHDVLIVAAAGNTYQQVRGYPAAYDNVVAVAATDANDLKAAFSSYGDWVDISAPGASIYSTLPNNRYGSLDGTSMASPFAASVAALIRSAFPDADVDEARRLLLEGADDIYNRNAAYRGLLGSGRINALRSLQLGARPMIDIDRLDITSDDNQSHSLDPGESAGLVVTLYNGEEAYPAEEVVVTLTTDDEFVIIRNAAVNFPNLGPGESYSNTDEPFRIVVVGEAYPHTAKFTVTVDAQPGNFSLQRDYELVVGHPNLLIVDDDGGADLETWYLSSLAEVRQGWVKWDVALNEVGPEREVMLEYPVVLWFTGNANPALDEIDLWQLDDALSSGANVILCSQYAGDDTTTHDLLRSFFGAEHQADFVSAAQVVGIEGARPIAQDVNLLLLGAGGAGNGRNSPSSMTPVNGADSLVHYKDNLGEITGIAGVYRTNPRTGAKTVYMGFALEGVSGRGDTTPRHVVLRQLIDWFTGVTAAPNATREGIPATYALAAPYPNPFNSVVMLRFVLPAGRPYRVWVSNLSGETVGELGQGFASTGENLMPWNAATLSSGVYFVNLRGSGLPALRQKLVLIK